ncbi:MAG: 4Fe-4S binding protein [Lentisphaerae bacterium]|nr:4Fe-4S binding protein [Lentisphaerota bacterium]
MADPGAQIAGLPRGAAGLVAGLGAFAVLAQTILFRAFFETFEGSEFGIAAFFASWLVWVAAGAAPARTLAHRAGAWPRLALLSLLYIPAAAAQLVLIARARDLAGVSPHDLFPVLRMLPAAFVVNAPVSLLTGFLFTAACAAARGTPGAVARVYAREALGGAAGGATVTVLLAAGITDERALLVGAACLALSAAPAAGGTRRAAAPLALAAGIAVALFAGADGWWTRAADLRAWSRLLPAESFAGRFATPQAVYRLGERDGAWIVQSRESVVETLPADAHDAEVAALHLAAAPHASRVLVIGPGSLGVAQAFLRVPSVREVVWLPPDPQYPAALLERLPRGLRPDSARFSAPARETRAFLSGKGPAFDLIVLHVPDPVSLSLNRTVSQDFLRLTASRLAEGGVAGLRMSGGENYLGPELARLGASMLETAESVFRHVMLKPGDESWLLMTDRLSDFSSPDRMSRLYAAIPGSEALAPGEVVRAAFPAGRAEAQLARYRAAQETAAPGSLLNRDAHPLALSAALAIGLKHSGARSAAAAWPGAVRPAAWALASALAALALLRCAARWRRRDPGAAVVPAGDIALLAAAAGAVGMATSLLLMCAWQTLHGGLFLHAGLLSALFMLGLWGGAAVSRAVAARAPSAVLLSAILLHAAALAVFAATGAAWSRPVFATAFAAAGALGGLYVPAAASLLARRGSDDASSGAWIETLDHLGGAAGSLAAGLVALPALGLGGSAAFVGALVLLVLPAALPFATAARRGCDDAADVALRRLGLATGVALLGALVFGAAWRADRAREGGDPLVRAARDMAPDALFRRIDVALPGGRTAACHVAGPETAPGDHVFSTAGFGARVQGYGGTIDLALRVGRDGALRDLRVLASRETPRYFARLDRWFESLRGLNVGDPAERRKVDGVSGATVSANAVADAIFAAGPVFAAAVLAGGTGPGTGPASGPLRLPRETLLLALFAAAAMVLRRFEARAWVRRLFLIAVVGVFGLWLNVQFSLFHLRMWIDPPWPRPSWGLSFVLPFAIPAVVLLAGNLYCGWLCPFGALQELVLALRPRRWRTGPPPWAFRWGRCVKYAMLAAAATVWVMEPAARLFDADPLTVAFSGEATRGMALLVLGALAASWLVPRFWCRVLCPSGALLSIVSALRPAERLWPRVRPRCCDLGVRARSDLDCLACDRCRVEGAAAVPAVAPAWRAALFAVTGLAACGGLVSLAARHAAPPAASPAPEEAAPAAETGTALSADQMREIRRRMQEGRLSSREALFYSAATNTPSPPAGGRQRRRGLGRDER